MAGWEDAGGWSFNESAYPTIPAAAHGSGKRAKKSAKNILHVSEADLLRPVRLAPGGQGATLGNPALKKRKGSSTEDAAAAGQQQAKKQKRDAAHAGGDAMEQPHVQKGKLKEKRKQEHRQQQQQPKPKPKQKQQQDQHSGQSLVREPGKQKQKQQSQPQPPQQVAGPANASRAADAAGSMGRVDTGANDLAQPLTNGSQQKKSKKKIKKQRQQGDAAPLSPPGEQQVPAASSPDRMATPAAGASTHQTSNCSKQPADNAAAQVTGTTKRSKHSKQAAAAPAAAAAAASAEPAPSAADAGPGPGSTDGGTAPSMLARLQGGAGGRGGSKLLEKMRQRLQGGAFRHLNELLYTSSSDTAFEEMQKDPSMFQQYHEGFQSQTRGWPMQPVQVAIDWLKRRPAEWVVADFGCGDALLGRSVPQTVHSLDLVASAPGVIACNMAHTPLEAASLDAAVFCLSLMGTDYGSFLVEACRLLKPKGWLWIAEVRSRFAAEGSTDCLKPLVRALARLGFVLDKSDTSNSHFVIMVLCKKGQPAGGPISWPPLKACLYKRR